LFYALVARFIHLLYVNITEAGADTVQAQETTLEQQREKAEANKSLSENIEPRKGTICDLEKQLVLLTDAHATAQKELHDTKRVALVDEETSRKEVIYTTDTYV
jgi:hypothetical protein